MFTVGLEFSLSQLNTLKRSVFGVGLLQVMLSILATTGIALILGISVTSALIIGSIVAMSSTAIVIKQLDDNNEISQPFGQHAIGILLFQDLAVILILVFVATVTGAHSDPIWQSLSLAFGKGVIATTLILVIGKYCLNPAFQLISKTKQIEIFTLATLFVSVGAAWLTHRLGLSYALGAFMAGMMLAECEHKESIKKEIRPFKDVLLGLFFVSIGLLVNINQFPEIWPWVLLMVIGFMLGKFLLIFILSYFFKFQTNVALQSALILAGGGEFGFAILSFSLQQQLIPSTWAQSILSALFISFLCTPTLIRHSKVIAHKLQCIA